MLSPRTIVVCPTSTPATSVIASSGPVGRMPTFSPRSAARGRGLEVVFWAAANAVSNKSVAVAKTLLTMGIAYDQIPVSWHRQIRSLPHRPTAVSDYLNDFRIVGKPEVIRLLPHRSSSAGNRREVSTFPQPPSQGFVGNFSSSLQTKGCCEENLALQFARAIFHNCLPRPERIPSVKTASKTGRPLAGLRRDCLPGTSRANCAGK